jgi:hypothetical protein
MSYPYATEADSDHDFPDLGLHGSCGSRDKRGNL